MRDGQGLAAHGLGNMQIECVNYVYEQGYDKPELDNWKWPG